MIGLAHRILAPAWPGLFVVAAFSLALAWRYRDRFGRLGVGIIAASTAGQVIAGVAFDSAGWPIAPRMLGVSLIFQAVVLLVVLVAKGEEFPVKRRYPRWW